MRGKILSHCRWNLLPQLKALPDKDSSSSYSLLLTQLLHNRGVTRPEDFPAFLASDRSLMGDPLLFPDMQKAVARVYQALLKGETIGIYGDFDADGITATALLVQGLSLLQGKTIPYIPHRQTEGHGLTTPVLKRLHDEQGVSLVITVDCGVTDIEEVKRAMKMGLDVIITDHHSPMEEIPEALAVINPKLNDSKYPYTNLAGVGVAFKLLQGLFRSLGKEEQIDGVMDLVAIGTIADMSPPLGENRFLIKQGLKNMNASPRPGISELINQTRLEAGNLDADRIAWVIAPCLNAAGRLADGLTGYNLLMAESEKEAQELAVWLTRKNEERQRLTTTTLARARELVIAMGLPPLLITADQEYPMGIAGLVAGRLTEEFYRPSVVIHTADTVCHGSCRSIPEFDIIAALNKFSKYFSRYGGHAAAAGFTMPTKNLPQLEQELSALAAEKLAGVELRPHLNIDAEVKLSDLGGDTYPTTQMLAPFGHGNPVPTFVSRGVEVVERRTMGNGNEHLRMKIRQGGSVWDGVAFRLGNHQGEFAPRIDIVYNLEVDNWGGKKQLRLNILDFKKSG
ncbi:MAG: single-stranded-DNA-specific exonuclease RecJ [Chloroflexi bacterium RBG_16_50_11]|nr:MAG: single-stranded-DNA-specific exonuclease RecJ [Chloroflexi bacterium RBG_16_50_11]